MPSLFRLALDIGLEFDSGYVGSEHVFIALARVPGEAARFFTDMAFVQAEGTALIERLNRTKPVEYIPDNVHTNAGFNRLLGLAQGIAWRSGRSEPEDIDILAAFFGDSMIRPILERSGASLDAVEASL